MKSSSSPRMTLALAVALLLVSLTISAVAAPLSLPRANNGRSLLNSSTPAWATAKNFKGPADPSTIVGFRVYLGWTNPSQVETLAQAVSDPRSTLYGQYLTSQQFRQQFAPSQSQVGQVQSWLRSQDFQVEYTPWNNHYVSAEGTIAQAQTAFGTSFGLYSVSGLTLRSPSSDLSVPSPLAGIVSGVLGLDDSMQLVHTDHTVGDAPPPPAFVSAQPCSSYWAEKLATGFTNPYGSNPLPYAPCGYTPQQIKGAYGISGYDGAGQTVAIIDAYAAPTIVQDVNQWSINRGIPSFTPNQLVQVVAPGTYSHPEKGNYQDPQGWYGEETLDIEAVHGMAPAAKIVYVGAPNNYQDLDAAMNHVVDRHLAQIVTNSYGFNTEFLPVGYIKPFEDTLIQAAIEGIGVYFSSGDNGDETSTQGFATPDWPASSPWVTAVGGTSLGVSASNTRAVETGWGTSTYSCNQSTLVCSRTGGLEGAGGGVSATFPDPPYKQM